MTVLYIYYNRLNILDTHFKITMEFNTGEEMFFDAQQYKQNNSQDMG